jgi:hypothetical protein
MHQKILRNISRIVYILTHILNKQPPVDDIPTNAIDHESEDFKKWAKGWQDKVYNDDTENPDITLGELLLVYFERNQGLQRVLLR